MSNSSLINYTKISPNRTSPRNHKIDRITIHHMAGNLTVEQCGNVFAPVSRKASANYGIGNDGRVGMYVEEKDRSWCSSNSANDHRAVTIEVANSATGEPWPVSDKALNKLVDLCVDICKRNGIPKLVYTGDTRGNLTMHRWFAPTGCPGTYLASKFSWIAEQVNGRLNGNQTSESKPPASGTLYRIRKSWSDAKSQIGAYRNLESAKKECKEGYSVYDEAGNTVYSNKPKAEESTGANPIIRDGQIHARNFAMPGLGADGIRGPRTKEAGIRVLQQAMNLDYGAGLALDGIWGPKSEAALKGHTVRRGETQYMVTALQILLMLKGYFCNGVENPGHFGAGLEAAVRQYQADHGLAVDGIAGYNTFKSLIS